MFDTRFIHHAETHPLRRAVLRPNEREEDMLWPGDDLPTSFHLGAFASGVLIGVASLYAEPWGGEPTAYRLRGMAVTPELRGRGAGAALVRACLREVGERGAKLVWCNARTSACGFYARLGFARVGDEFEIKGVGPHYVMHRST